ncbi:unnamed protein product, partial [Iphiclides podalirius]
MPHLPHEFKFYSGPFAGGTAAPRLETSDPSLNFARQAPISQHIVRRAEMECRPIRGDADAGSETILRLLLVTCCIHDNRSFCPLCPSVNSLRALCGGDRRAPVSNKRTPPSRARRAPISPSPRACK